MRSKESLAKSLRSLAVAGVSFGGLASAAITVTHIQDIAPALTPYVSHTPYTPTAFTSSSTDLANGLTPTAAGGPATTNELSRGVAAWTDGSIGTVYKENGPGGDAVDHAAYGSVGSGTVVTFNLGSAFSLSSIDVFQGWNDGGRDSAAFTVWVAGPDQNFSQIASQGLVVAGAGNLPDNPVSHMFRIADDGGLAIANVQFVRLDFGSADNTWAGLTEVDINAVPEPGVTLLGVLGGLALLRRKRR